MGTEKKNKKTQRAEAKAAKEKKVTTTEAPLPQAVAKPARVAKPREPRADGLANMPKLPSASRARKPKPMVDCTCGCGGQTRGLWVPGHDARAKGWALRIERDILKLADVPANERKGAEYMLKARKDLGTTGKIKLVAGKEKPTESAIPDANAVNE